MGNERNADGTFASGHPFFAPQNGRKNGRKPDLKTILKELEQENARLAFNYIHDRLTGQIACSPTDRDTLARYAIDRVYGSPRLKIALGGDDENETPIRFITTPGV